ncbi:hypothetical protein [Micromonospora carbonacea]|nr:hypothetical protein [Micromonospora carbonacea]
MVDAARLLAASGVSLVVESSVLSPDLLRANRAGNDRGPEPAIHWRPAERAGPFPRRLR